LNAFEQLLIELGGREDAKRAVVSMRIRKNEKAQPYDVKRADDCSHVSVLPRRSFFM